MLHDALLYDELDDGYVQCKLCAHRCQIKSGNRGICRVRENRDGKLYTLVYGNLISTNIDPIEKKPLYHYLPGSTSFSIATPGCNFRCEWCQNWQISQMPRLMNLPRGKRFMPDTIVNQALESGCQSISYTYTEPTIFFEYSLDSAKLAQAKGLKNVYVTNGFMTSEMLEMLHPYLDAANVDIKAFRDESYRKWMGGRLEPVLDSCRKIKSLGIWLEVTTLIVPGMNDDPEELWALANFIYHELGSETPWHLSRFYPQYERMNSAPTEEGILYESKRMAEDLGLSYVYIGNVFGRDSTKCRTCGNVLIKRSGYSVILDGFDAIGACKTCGTPFDGVLCHKEAR
jgi:pyruvate formate lyase activating enzyme